MPGASRLAIAALGLAAAVASGGCQSHIQLRAAAGPAAPLAQRLLDYRALKPMTPVRQPYLYVMTAVQRHFLLLADGRRVHDPQDLLAVVRPDSPTARYAGKVRRLRRIQFWVGLVGLTLTAVGATLAGVGFSRDNQPLGITGSVVGGVGLLGGYQLGGLFDALAKDTTLSAFTSYDRALRAFLRLSDRDVAEPCR